MLRYELPISWVKCTFVQGWVSNTIVIASRWPSMVPHRGARGRATSVYLTPWPPTCSGEIPMRCTIEVAALLAFTVDATIQDAPGRLSHTCTCQRRGKHRDHSKAAGVSQQWSKGSYSTHSPALSATCIYLSLERSWPITTVWATAPCRERAATWCCSLEPLLPQTVIGQ